MKKAVWKGKTFIIVGGSKGIGQGFAFCLTKMGANLFLVARGFEALQETVEKCKSIKQSDSQFIESAVCDATQEDQVRQQFGNFIQKHGVPDYLINMAGYAFPEYAWKLRVEDIRKNTDTNFYSQLIPSLVILPYFMKERKGHIVNAASYLSFAGLIGYLAYAPSKHAIVGMSRVLKNEMKPYNIHFSLTYPPDTDTPGFAQENQTKPEETRIMSETAGLWSPEDTAKQFLVGIYKKKFHILVGFITKISFLLSKIAPRLYRNILWSEHKKARKKLKKQGKLIDPFESLKF